MATIFLKIDNIYEGLNNPDFYIIRLTNKQLPIFRRANRKYSGKDKNAFICSLLCFLNPYENTLQQNKQIILQSLENFKDLSEVEDNNIDLSLLLNQQQNLNNFFSGPYAIIKVNRNPINMVSKDIDDNYQQIIIYNNINKNLFVL